MASNFEAFLAVALLVVVTTVAAQTNLSGRPLPDVPVAKPRAGELADVPSMKENGPASPLAQPAVLPPGSSRFDVLNSNRIHVEGFQSIIEPKRAKRFVGDTIINELDDDEDGLTDKREEPQDPKSREDAEANPNNVEGSGAAEEMRSAFDGEMDKILESFSSSSSDVPPAQEENEIIPLTTGSYYDPDVTSPSSTSSPQQPEPRGGDDEEEEEDDEDEDEEMDWGELNLMPTDMTRKVTQEVPTTPAPETDEEEDNDIEDDYYETTTDDSSTTEETTTEESTTESSTEEIVTEGQTNVESIDVDDDWDFSDLNLADKVGNGEESTVPDATNRQQPTVSPSGPSSVPAFGSSKMIELLKSHIGLIVGVILGIPATVVLCYFLYVKLLRRRNTGSLNVSTSSLSGKKRRPSTSGPSYPVDPSRQTLISEVNELQQSPNGKGPRPPPMPHKTPVHA